MKISVIIPVYNVEAYLEECINSVLNQCYDNMEIIAINDGSTDHSLDILRKFKKQITLINQKNFGVGYALNQGIRSSSGDLITFIDGDDIWLPEKIIRQVKFFQIDPLLEMSFGKTIQFLSPELESENTNFKFEEGPLSGISRISCMTRKHVFEKYGFFPEYKHGVEFIDWFDSAKANDLYYCQADEAFVKRRIRKNSLSQNEYYYPSLLNFLKSRIENKRLDHRD